LGGDREDLKRRPELKASWKPLGSS
jgi:hypothetical protein